MDSSSVWSPPTELSPETCPLLDSIFPQQMPPHRTRVPSSSNEFLGDFCSSTSPDDEEISARFSSEALVSFDDCTLDAAVLAVEASQFIQDSHLGDSSQSHHSQVQDAFLPNGSMSKRAKDCPTENRNNCKNGIPKKIKVDESCSPPKTQISHSQLRKLSEKITALQQLVSPFGKSDTASVLSEAIGYIKFLQEQVHVLSSPYMTPIVNKKVCDAPPDLRSRGLCLVPISCTRNVATDSNGADFWISGISQ